MPSRSHSASGTPPGDRRPGRDPEGASLDYERTRLVEAVLGGLPPRDREVLSRFYLLEQPPEQICAELGLTETQLRLIKSRVKARFAALSRKVLPLRREPASAAATGRVPAGGFVGLDRVIPIVAHAVAVFGDEQKASRWLKTPLPVLGDRSPAEILSGGRDIEAIDVILTRIEHNIPS